MKIKLFFGVFLNKVNAQDLTCLTLLKYLDENVFEIRSLSIHNGDLPLVSKKNLKCFHCFRPFKISGIIGYTWGIITSDVIYLPRAELWKYNHWLLKILKKPSMKTVENLIDDISIRTALARFKGIKNIIKAYSQHTKVYAISPHVKSFNYEKHGLTTESDILYLPCDNGIFEDKRIRTTLENIIFISLDMERKGIGDIFKLAEVFPNLTFHVVGRCSEILLNRMSNY
ncbi:MAG: hypothetical protein JNL74_19690, partial [Fibrobacteres bacterium]|nr:hypothetical protein [Fibrobacterota bacterium]